MAVYISVDDPLLQVEIDYADPESLVQYQYEFNGKWRRTSYKTADLSGNVQQDVALIYDFFDKQWRGC